MSGGIIIQRRAVLLPVSQDPCIYAHLSDKHKACIDAIAAKGPDETSEEDIEKLASLIHRAVHS